MNSLSCKMDHNMKKILISLLLLILFSCDDRDNIGDVYNFEGTLVINEINYNSSDGFDSGDWVELYNATDELLDIENWIFKDEDDVHIFPILENTMLSAGEYLVLCSDTNSFTALFPDVNNFVGNLGFSFSGNGELLRLFNSEGELVDFVTYDDSDPWPVGPDGNGPTLELIDSFSDNTLAENWSASDGNGTPGQSNN